MRRNGYMCKINSGYHTCQEYLFKKNVLPTLFPSPPFSRDFPEILRYFPGISSGTSSGISPGWPFCFPKYFLRAIPSTCNKQIK